MNTKEPCNHTPPFKIGDTFRTAWVKVDGVMTEARWRIRYLDGISGLPTSVELETIDDTPTPLGMAEVSIVLKDDRTLTYVYRPLRASRSYTFWTDIKWERLKSGIFSNILDACEAVERQVSEKAEA